MTTRIALVLTLSLALHALGFGAFYDPDEVVIQGGAPAASARLGNSFADMVSGVSAPVTPEEAEEVAPDENVQREAADATVEPVDAQTTRPVPVSEASNAESPVQPAMTPNASSQAPQLVDKGVVVAPKQEPIEPTRSATPTIAALPNRQPNDRATTADATTSETAVQQTTQVPVDPKPETEAQAALEVSETPSVEETKTTEVEEVIRGQTPIVVQQADENTERPRKRPDNRRADDPARPAPQGTATQDATRGSSTGRREATSNTTASSNRSAAQQGNSAAATNYPGRVWSQLQRSRKSRRAGRGSAVISFRIGRNGGLAGITISRSSGNPRLDQAALRHVRRAAPFPPPPAGAQTRFAFTYEVK